MLILRADTLGAFGGVRINKVISLAPTVEKFGPIADGVDGRETGNRKPESRRELHGVRVCGIRL